MQGSQFENVLDRVVFLAAPSEENIHRAVTSGARGVIEVVEGNTQISTSILNHVDKCSLFISLSTRSAVGMAISGVFARLLGEKLRLDDANLVDLETAVQEAVANAVMHGNLQIDRNHRNGEDGFQKFSEELSERLASQEHGLKRIELLASWNDTELKISVIDQGKGYCPKLPPAGEGDRRKTGRGLSIIRQLMARVAINDHGQRVDMVLKLTKPPQISAMTKVEALETAVVDSEMDQQVLSARILVVDDDETARLIIEETLMNAGFNNLLFAEDGIEGRDAVENWEPDMVVLDVMMPRLNGDELCQQLRANPKHANLPILIQTAFDEHERMIDLLQHGASDVVSKPLNASEFLARLRIHLERTMSMKTLEFYRDRVVRELEQARQTQTLLLPSAKQISMIEERCRVGLSACSRPSSELGGDHWGIVPIDETAFAVYLADFSGHGVSAAVNVFRLHTLFDQLSGDYRDVKSVVSELNEGLVGRLPLGQYATLLYGVVDLQKRQFEYVTAGSIEPLLFDAGTQTVKVLKVGGLPLGIAGEVNYQVRRSEFTPGSKLLLYSDALLEANLPGGEMFGLQRLQALLNAKVKDVHDILEPFYDTVGRSLNDDLTAILVST